MEFGHQEFSVRFLKAFFKMSFNALLSPQFSLTQLILVTFLRGVHSAHWTVVQKSIFESKIQNYRVSQQVSDNFVEHF